MTQEVTSHRKIYIRPNTFWRKLASATGRNRLWSRLSSSQMVFQRLTRQICSKQSWGQSLSVLFSGYWLLPATELLWHLGGVPRAVSLRRRMPSSRVLQEGGTGSQRADRAARSLSTDTLHQRRRETFLFWKWLMNNPVKLQMLLINGNRAKGDTHRNYTPEFQ